MSTSTCVFEWRYGSREMRELFSVSSIVKKYIEVEKALVKALVRVGIAPSYCIEEVEKCSSSVDPMEVYRREAVTGHDIASLVFILSEKCGECSRFIHYGATSYDVVDTAWSLILREALGLIESKLKRVILRLSELAVEYADAVVVGRTHGQHALPITFGFKFANYAYELARSYERLRELSRRLIRLKMSGSVGTMASWGRIALEIERAVSEELGLEPHAVTTQVAPRDGFAELVSDLAILASQLDRLALEVRELSRTEISEVYEAAERVGSSAMPHKRNPVVAERISGLAKVVRSLVTIALENIPLMHERDLTNSSSERILLPHAVLAVDQMLEDTIKLLETMVVDCDAARRNLELTRGAVYSELLVTRLVDKGLPRHKAYYLVMETVKSMKPGETLVEAVLGNTELSRYFTREELQNLVQPESALVNVKKLIERALDYVSSVLLSDGVREH
ncbi:MAG: adenylosuccinate lyase [Desulfurococcaceae archaeon]